MKIYKRFAAMSIKSGDRRVLRTTVWCLPIPFTKYGLALVWNGWIVSNTSETQFVSNSEYDKLKAEVEKLSAMELENMKSWQQETNWRIEVEREKDKLQDIAESYRAMLLKIIETRDLQNFVDYPSVNGVIDDARKSLETEE
jgi:uncharacterized protein (DUF1684 family)